MKWINLCPILFSKHKQFLYRQQQWRYKNPSALIRRWHCQWSSVCIDIKPQLHNSRCLSVWGLGGYDNCLSPVSPIQLPVLRQGQPPVSVHATTHSCHAILGPCHTARGSPQISRREIGTLVHKDHKKQPALRIFANQTACRLWSIWQLSQPFSLDKYNETQSTWHAKIHEKFSSRECDN